MKASVTARISFLLAILLALSCFVSCGDVESDPSSQISEGVSEPNTEESGTTEVSTPEYEGFKIAMNGEVLSSILISDSASSKERRAALDLQKHLKAIIGKDVSIVRESNAVECEPYICVGNTAFTESAGIEIPVGYPGDERVIVKQTGDNLYILGNDSGNYNGTQYAVNMFLEHLGCGWFGVDDLWSVIPSLTDIDVTDLSIDHTAKFSSRITRLFESEDPDYSELASRWYLGGNVSLTGHWLFQIAPASMYAEHPEWYALTNNTRNPAGYDYFQFCYSNKDFAAYVAEKLDEFFIEHPEIISMTIAYNDGWDEHFCVCDECKALGNASDCMVDFANNVARLVGVKYPERTLQIYVYHMTYEPPINEVTLEPNVELMFCREASMTQPIDADYFKSGYDAITRNTYTCSWRENFQKWINKTHPTHTSVWEWQCISAEKPEWQNVPWIQGNVATRNQNAWEELGVDYVYYDQGPLEGYREDKSSVALRWPLWYVTARSSWGSDKTGEELLRDACAKLYGDAADEMLAYYMKLAEISEDCPYYSVAWVPCTVRQMYKAQKRDITTLVNAVRAAYNNCTETEKQRIDVQLEYWNKTLEILG